MQRSVYTFDDAVKSLREKGVEPAIKPPAPSPTDDFYKIHSKEGIPPRYSEEQKFEEWYKLEMADEEMRRKIANLPKCPSYIIVCIWRRDGEETGREPMDSDNGQWRGLTKAGPFHPGSEWCMRSSGSDSPSQQCCYDKEGILMTSGSAAGTPDRENPYEGVFGWLRHIHHDLRPYTAAKQLDKGDDKGPHLTKYRAVRPPSQGGGSCYK